MGLKAGARHISRRLRVGLLAGLVVVVSHAGIVAAQDSAQREILRDLHNFSVTGRVLYIAAHPDDENTQLIAYLANGRHYRTAYLSLTRGDGGQNVLGPEFGDELGVLRTQELLAARRIDGGRQFFSRAIDFGFSKDPRETLRIWNHQAVLSDIVRVIREFRPDVLITRFSPTAGHTHGHHTASAMLALEAFKLAGNPAAFPEQLKALAPWQPKRIFWNGGGFQRDDNPKANHLRINAGGDDPITGESFADIAGRSRSMHKTQGFGNFRGGGRGEGPRWESFELLDGAPATNDILDGVDATWARFPGGAEIGQMSESVLTKFDGADPAASVADLLKIKARLAGLPTDSVLQEKSRLLDRIIRQCLGLKVATTVPRAEVVPGETLSLHYETLVTSAPVPVRWMAVRYPSLGQETEVGMDLVPGRPATRDATETLPASTPLTQPYWLRQVPGQGIFTVNDPELIGRPENPAALPLEQVFQVGDQTLVLPDEPVQRSGASDATSDRRLEVISPVSLKFSSEVGLFAPKAVREIAVELTAARPNLKGELRLRVPEGWEVSPARRKFQLGNSGARERLVFRVTAPRQPTTAIVSAQAQIAGKSYDNDQVRLSYPHIPSQLLQPRARLRAVCLDLAVRGKRIGYLPGAGDSIAEALQAMGYSVTSLTGSDLTRERLKEFDAVVIGVRAFNVREDLVAHTDALFGYVEAGGTLVEQYNRPNGLKTERLAPYELHLSSERVTDETAPVTFLAPDNPALNTPNKITTADFTGWIQEQGIYYPDRWDEHFTPLLASHDPGEAPLKGGLLVASYGQGHFVYTGLVFFRQLPAGVPGAYRLFANLVSLGK